MHDAFISYAVEDNDFASKVAYGLLANGLSVWYAPLSLGVGDKLLDSIERGIEEARTGVLVISGHYLSKSWTSYEMDILIRHQIEKSMKLLPIWLGVAKDEVENRHCGLSGLVAITEVEPLDNVISKLVLAMSEGARTRGIIPTYESPAYRFLVGLGEVNLNSIDGPATTIYEFLIHAKDADYPLWLAGKTYSKDNLLLEVARLLGPEPGRIKNWVGEQGFGQLWKMCLEHGINPSHFY